MHREYHNSHFSMESERVFFKEMTTFAIVVSVQNRNYQDFRLVTSSVDYKFYLQTSRMTINLDLCLFLFGECTISSRYLAFLLTQMQL